MLSNETFNFETNVSNNTFTYFLMRNIQYIKILKRDLATYYIYNELRQPYIIHILSVQTYNNINCELLGTFAQTVHTIQISHIIITKIYNWGNYKYFIKVFLKENTMWDFPVMELQSFTVLPLVFYYVCSCLTWVSKLIIIMRNL